MPHPWKPEETVRALLADVYTSEGVEIVLKSRNLNLDNRTPLDVLAEDPSRAIEWARSLAAAM